MNRAKQHGANHNLRRPSLCKQLRATKAMLYLLNQGGELKRLIVWADKKQARYRSQKFAGIGRSYRLRLGKSQTKLRQLRARFPRGYWMARLLHGLSNLLSVRPVFSRARAR